MASRAAKLPDAGWTCAFAAKFAETFLDADVDVGKRNRMISKWMDKVEKRMGAVQRCASDNDSQEQCERTCQVEGSGRRCDRCMQKIFEVQALHACWAMILPVMIPTIIDTLGSNGGRFMRCLTLRISYKMVQTYPMFNRLIMRRFQFTGRGMVSKSGEWDDVNMEEPWTRIGEDGSEDSEEVEEVKLWEKLAPQVPERHLPWWLLARPHLIEQQFFWCGVHGLLESASADLLDGTHPTNFRMLCALAKQHNKSGIFRPVASQAILNEHWRALQWWYYGDLICNATTIAGLFQIVWKSKPHATDAVVKLPCTIGLVIVGTVNVYSLVCFNLLEFCMAYCEFRHEGLRQNSRWRHPRSWFGPYMSFWNVWLVLTEVWLLYSVSHMVSDKVNNYRGVEMEQSFLGGHPIHLALIIAVKWINFMVLITTLECWGVTTLPAFMAMRSPESKRFLVYLLMMVLMVTHAYFSLPLEPGDYEANNTNIAKFEASFVRMFRLAILGDFDLWELEGTDPKLNETTKVIDEDPNDYLNGTKGMIHDDMRLIVMVCALVTSVMMINMYIGVLSKEYEVFRERKIEIFYHVKAVATVNYSLRRRFWIRALHRCCCCCCLSVDCIRWFCLMRPKNFDVPTHRKSLTYAAPRLRDLNGATDEQDGNPDSEESDESEFVLLGTTPRDLDSDSDKRDGDAWKTALVSAVVSRVERLLQDEQDGNVWKCLGFWTTVPRHLVSELEPGFQIEDQVQSMQGELRAIRALLEELPQQLHPAQSSGLVVREPSQQVRPAQSSGLLSRELSDRSPPGM